MDIDEEQEYVPATQTSPFSLASVKPSGQAQRNTPPTKMHWPSGPKLVHDAESPASLQVTSTHITQETSSKLKLSAIWRDHMSCL